MPEPAELERKFWKALKSYMTMMLAVNVKDDYRKNVAKVDLR